MNWRSLIKSEFIAIFTNAPLLVTVFAGVIFYSFLYPLPYAKQTLREQKIAVVNLDNSQISRTLTRMVEATPQIKITHHVSSVEQAKLLLLNSKIQGLLVIPNNFYRDLMLDKSPTLAFAGNAAYFLVYGTIIEGLSQSTGTLAAQIKISRMVVAGNNIALASKQYSDIKLNMRPIFNPTMGYIDYVVPAVFVLILHQTLLIALGLLTGGQNEIRLKKQIPASQCYWLCYPVWQLMLVRTAIMMAIYLPLVAYYFGYSFASYGVSRLASITDLITLTIPFLLSVIFLGMIIGQLIPRKELATLIVVLSSLPLVFSAGFIWPTSSIPTVINVIAQFSPSTPAINAFLQLNQMGASFEQVVNLWGQLWLLTFIYAGIAGLLMKRHNQVKRVSSKLAGIISTDLPVMDK